MYPAISFLPWMQMVIILWFFTIVFEGKLFSVRNPINKTIKILFIVVLMSSVFALSPQTAFSSLQDIIILILCYYLIIYSITNGKQLFVFILFYLLINFKLSHFAFLKWVARGFEYEKYGAVVGMAWLRNPGEFAIQMCIAFAISTYFLISVWPYIHWFKKLILISIPVTCFGSVIASGSRGAFLGLAFVLLAMWFYAKKKMFGAIVLILIMVSTPFLMAERDMERLQNMGAETDGTAQNRLERWAKGIEMVKAYPVFGVGFSNWGEADEKMFDGTGALSHNIFIECSSELGLTGLAVFLFLIFFTLKNNRETRKVAMQFPAMERNWYTNLSKALDLSLLAYLVTGFFVTVFYYPYFWINLGMTVSLNNVVKIEAKDITDEDEE
ncbi:MAG: O-antigen ligase family protein [Desulfobacterales bacterium]|nr:O-antigen ligase family protein [Desulfobacterales bacterium]